MTTLFRRLKPAQNFRITKRQIAKFLQIPESLIVKVDHGATLSLSIAATKGDNSSAIAKWNSGKTLLLVRFNNA